MGKEADKEEEEEYMKNYYDLSNEGGYGGIKRLVKSSKHANIQSTSKWLRTQPTYSLHKPFRKRFPTRKYKTSSINDLWQMDLMEMIPYASINKGYRYILTCIDVFSRLARAEPLKSKNSRDVTSAIGKMLKVGAIPRHIQTDLGKEFYNKDVQSLFKKHKINHYTVYSQFKAALVERFNRTLREKLNRYFTHKGKKTWYDILPTIIDTYNHTKHRGINLRRPVDIGNENEQDVWEEQQQSTLTQQSSSHTHPLLTYVRISRIAKGPFNKNFDQNWSEEVFRIVAVDKKSYPPMYTIEDLSNNVIEGKFYHQELQDIGPKPPQVYRIEKIIKSRGKGEAKEYFVKWHGYDSTHNTWIPAKNLV